MGSRRKNIEIKKDEVSANRLTSSFLLYCNLLLGNQALINSANFVWYDTANGDEWNLERPGEIFSQQYFKTYADIVEM